jgi:hypothetical protein
VGSKSECGDSCLVRCDTVLLYVVVRYVVVRYAVVRYVVVRYAVVRYAVVRYVVVRYVVPDVSKDCSSPRSLFLITA